MSTEMEIAFPTLSARQIAELKERGTVREVKVGDVLFAEGDRNTGFFVVLPGAVEILQRSRCLVDEVFLEPAPKATNA